MSAPEPSAAGGRAGPPPPRPTDRLARLRGVATALLVFLAADLVLFHQFAVRDVSTDSGIPSLAVYRAMTNQPAAEAGQGPWDGIWENDLRIVIWTISRNARALGRGDLDLFDAEACFPSHDSLALGEPGISQAVLVAPVCLVTRDPIATFNALLFVLPLVSAMAMFLLVGDWTGSRASGIAAGLLYGFHPIKTWDVVHPYVWDTAWTVLALFFAARLFSAPRWRYALGLSVCTAFQIAGSFYALLSAVVVAVPFLGWLVWSHGISRPRLARLALAGVLPLLVAWFVMAPYLGLRSSGVLSPRDSYFFVDPAWVLPGGFLFPGWTLLLFAALCLVPRRAAGLRLKGDPRWVLALAGVLLLLLSTPVSGAGPEGEPGAFGLYRWLAGFVPGLDVVRSPASLYAGVHLTLCILAGLGCAAGLAALDGRLRATAGAAAIAISAASVLGPRLLDPDALGYRFVSVRPDPESIGFFTTLAQRGNTGPILDVPIPPNPEAPRVSRSILLSAYHGRRTSACRNSYVPPELEVNREIARALPSSAAFRRAQQLGFTTVLLHHPPGKRLGRLKRRAFERFVAEHPDGPAIRIHGNEQMTAYALVPEAAAEGAPRPR